MELKKYGKTIIIGVIIGVITGVIVGVIIIPISSIISIIYTSYFFEFLVISILLIIILGSTIRLIKYKMNKKEEHQVLEWITKTPKYMGYIEYPDKKLKWCIRIQEPQNILITENNPRCPKCNKKIEQKEHYLWYEWICNNPNCNYTNYRTWNHKTILRSKVENLIKNKKTIYLD